jgi:hypothetical protein
VVGEADLLAGFLCELKAAMAANLRPFTGVVATILLLAGPLPCHAVTISYVGTEPGGAPSGFATANWSNPGVPKLYATGTSNEYGKDGYWQIRPIPDPASSNVSGAVGSGNNLGTSASPFPTLWSGSNPSFVSSITGAAGTFVNFGGYADYRGPDGSTLYRQGALSVSVNQGPFLTPSGNNTGFFGETLSFTLNYAGTVRVGLAVDSVGSGTFAPDYVGIYSPTTGTVFSSLLTRNGTPDMAVFDIVNPTGQSFTVAQWQLTGTNNVSAMSLVTFDVIPVPEPSVVALLSVAGIAGGLCHRRRRKEPEVC